MKLKEKLARDACRVTIDELNKLTDAQSVSSVLYDQKVSLFLEGFNAARKLALNTLKAAEFHDVDELIPLVRNLGEEGV